MTNQINRTTFALEDGVYVETERQYSHDRLRIRVRVCKETLVLRAYRETFARAAAGDVARWLAWVATLESLPKEFLQHPQSDQSADPVCASESVLPYCTAVRRASHTRTSQHKGRVARTSHTDAS